MLLKNKFSPSDLLFVKIGINDASRKQVRNEIAVLNELSGKDIAPEMKAYGDFRDNTFLVTKAYSAQKIKSFDINDEIFSIINSIAALHPLYTNENGFLYSFSHGDFCPWNLLKVNGELKVIDWEMGGSAVLGYDLFTYIFKTNFELNPGKKCADLIAQNKGWLDKFYANYGINGLAPLPYRICTDNED